MNKVYVVSRWDMYDSQSYVAKIFSSAASAHSYVKRQPASSAYDFEIDEWEVED